MQKRQMVWFLLVMACMPLSQSIAMESHPITDKDDTSIIAEDLYQEGLTYRYSNNNHSLAQEFFHAAAEKGHRDALNELAFIFQLQEKYIQAIECYEKALQKGSVHACICIAQIYRAQKKTDAAEFYYKKAIQIAPNNNYYTIMKMIVSSMASMYREHNWDTMANESNLEDKLFLIRKDYHDSI